MTVVELERQGRAADATAALPLDEERELTAFVFREARYADESRYDEWEALWTSAPEATYWLPTSPDKMDPDRYVSLIYDNRARIATRIRQLKTGYRYAQIPVSPMRRVVSNFEMRRVTDPEYSDAYEVESNFLMVEIAVQSTRNQNIWAGRTIHRLRRENGELKIHHKRVMLVNGDEPLGSIAFIL
jgi:3-phenylpropionate/cinnamic acid dioxygenase small subunit